MLSGWVADPSQAQDDTVSEDGSLPMGSSMVKTLPRPGPGLSAQTWPPCPRTMLRVM